MSKNVSKAGIRFRRVLNKLGKYTMFVITVITCYNITTHLFELRAERIKKEKNKRTIIAVFSVLSWIIGICAALAGIFKYIKYLKKGYLLDLLKYRFALDLQDRSSFVPADCQFGRKGAGNDTDDGQFFDLDGRRGWKLFVPCICY